MRNRTEFAFRHELKFIISQQERKFLTRRLQILLPRDENVTDQSYSIRSLYFDDAMESAYEDKIAGVESRKKYRIRLYNYSTKVIKLERKKKEGAYIQKISAFLTPEEADLMMQGDYDFLRNRQEKVCQEFYREHVWSRMHPAVIVDYEREPYVYPYGDVRITFDSHVRAGLLTAGFLDRDTPAAEVMEPGKLVMEVKFTEYLPEAVRDLLPVADSAYVAYSKYTMCLEKKKELSQRIG